MDDNQIFHSQVFAAELEEIDRRRANCAEEYSAPPLRNDFTTTNNLTGLACSGGGIRSASFSLGVIQYLITHNLFSKIDYLSTVSGGGYIGSCISALAKDDAANSRLLTDRVGRQEPEALNHIRNYSEYLSANGFLNAIRLPVLFVEGVLRSILIFLPLVILATFITEAFFELTGTVSADYQWYTPLIGLMPLVVSLLLRPILKDRQGWAGRDSADARLAIYAGIAAAALLAVPLFALLREVVHHDAATLAVAIGDWIGDHALSVALISFSALAFLILGWFKLRAKLLLVVASILAPALLLISYVFFCVEAINSPYSYDDQMAEKSSLHATAANSNSKLIVLLQGLHKTGTPIDCEDVHIPKTTDAIEGYKENRELCDALNITFIQKSLHLENFTIVNRDPSSIELVTKYPNADFNWQNIRPWFLRHFTTHNSQRLDITLVEELGTDKQVLKIDQLRLFDGNAEWWLYLLGIIIQLYNWAFINVNRFSLHPFYRDRLSRTFLITGGADGIVSADNLKLSELNGAKSQAPYHIINTALNLQGSADPQLRARKTVPFILSKRHCGSDFTGYCKTEDMEATDPHMNLGTAMAISAAAASPNMGTGTIKSLSFLLTLLNVRLNYWLPHPGKLGSSYWKRSFRLKPLGLLYLIKEALGLVSERTPYINCSDGGHIENLAIYELLRRQCKTIICIDAEADPHFTFSGLVTLQRYAAIDLGATIAIDVSQIRPQNGLSAQNFAEGRIQYNNGETGRLLYLKLSFTGSEPEYLRYYRCMNPAYPHQPTSDQSFDETQFEAYRALGYGVAESAAKNLSALLRS